MVIFLAIERPAFESAKQEGTQRAAFARRLKEILNAEMMEIELPVTVSILFYDFFVVAATKGKAELIEWLEGDVFAKVAPPTNPATNIGPIPAGIPGRIKDVALIDQRRGVPTTIIAPIPTGIADRIKDMVLVDRRSSIPSLISRWYLFTVQSLRGFPPLRLLFLPPFLKPVHRGGI